MHCSYINIQKIKNPEMTINEITARHGSNEVDVRQSYDLQQRDKNKYD